jgi:hypothetical protein
MQTLGCVEVEEFRNLANVKGILWTGYNGQAQGVAIPRLLFGEATPGGKNLGVPEEGYYDLLLDTEAGTLTLFNAFETYPGFDEIST